VISIDAILPNERRSASLVSGTLLPAGPYRCPDGILVANWSERQQDLLHRFSSKPQLIVPSRKAS
jgi:hypothetical protein